MHTVRAVEQRWGGVGPMYRLLSRKDEGELNEVAHRIDRQDLGTVRFGEYFASS